MIVGLRQQPIRVEIVNEPRIELTGAYDPDLKVPTLLPESMFAEKLLANADRCQDRAVAYRDAFDLGRLVETYEAIPEAAVNAAEGAYGKDIARFMAWVLNRLRDRNEIRYAAEALDMDFDGAAGAVAALRRAALNVWPDKGIEEAVSGL
jgi:hypothetical protein